MDKARSCEKMKKNFNLIHILIVAFASPFILFWIMNNNQTQVDSSVSSSIIFESDDNKPLSVVGTTLVENQKPYYFEETGIVMNVFKKVGEKVEPNDLIANLDIEKTRILQINEMKKAESLLKDKTILNKQLNHIKELYRRKFYTAGEYLEKTSEVFRYLKNWDDFNIHMEKLKKLTNGKEIRSKVSGTIVSLSVNERQKINKIDLENPGVWIESTEKGRSYIELEITDDLTSKISKGMKVEAGLALNSSAVIEATIESLSEVVTENQKNRYFKAKALINKSTQKIITGMRVMANIFPKGSKKRIWIPNAALDIFIPDSEITKTVSYIDNNNNINNSDVSSNDTSDINNKIIDGAIIKNASSKIFPNSSNLREIYLLSKDEKIIKAIVETGVKNSRFTEVKSSRLIGARVLINKSNKRWF
jgi:multidrug efflux pump subunit AcrA (membrane-fusion protein)